MPRKQKVYNFTLKNVKIEIIVQKYGLDIFSNLANHIPPENTTRIEELTIKKTPDLISFLDATKNEYKCIPIMIDFSQQKPLSRNHNCFWCRNSIPANIIPIGCPIFYNSPIATKKYYSEISKDIYTINEKISKNREKILKKENDERIRINKNSYYLTDGIFCSFNCIKAYILDNKHNPRYLYSPYLLQKLYKEIFNTSDNIIEPAPSWRILVEYGGVLTIEEFRKSFNKIEYVYKGKTIPKFISSISLFEENLKF